MRISRLALSAALVFVLAGCSADEPAPSGQRDTEPRSAIIQPGRPGESNRTLDPDTTLEAPSANDADVTFMQMMVPHHAQALEMSELAQTRARDEQVDSLARRIKGAQGPEIQSMTEWLRMRGHDVGHEGHATAMTEPAGRC